MDLEEKLNEHTMLHSIEESSIEYGDKCKILSYILFFTFYDCDYQVFVDREDIDADESFGLCMEGQAYYLIVSMIFAKTSYGR